VLAAGYVVLVRYLTQGTYPEYALKLPRASGLLGMYPSQTITNIRLPRTEMNIGDVITASAEKPDKGKIPLAVTGIETLSLNAISPFEAEQEGFISPDFYSSRHICGNIEVRMDFEDHVFPHEGETTRTGNSKKPAEPARLKMVFSRLGCFTHAHIVAIARRLAGLIWTLLKNGEDYEVRHFKTGAGKETESLARTALSA
jgi:hypothetical protein